MGEYDITHHWEAYASEWTSWARTPDHDEYWSYRDQFREFVPTPGTATLEVGCGEGRVSRDLTALGHHVTAVDLSPSLVAAAQEAGSAGRCYVADAALSQALTSTNGSGFPSFYGFAAIAHQ